MAGGALGVGARAERTGDPLLLSSSPYFKVRLSAARLLGRHEDRASTLRLHALLSDPHPLVRLVAQSALDRREIASTLCRSVAMVAPR